MSPTSASTLFSGGSDSTLAAVLMLERHEHVHLLVCKTSVMFHVERGYANALSFQEHFGKDRVTIASLDCTPEFHEIYRGDYWNDVKHFGPYITALTCAACSLSWHTRAIPYDVQRGVTHASDGERWEDPPIWAELMPDVLEEVRKLYAEFGIAYENPCYRIDRTDWELHKRGLARTRDMKLEGFKAEEKAYEGDANKQWKSGQPNCHGGIVGAIYLSCCMVPRGGQKKNEELAMEYYARKIPVARKLIQARLEKEGRSVPAGAGPS